jgi:tetratricopeptide (TPR) repeat protein
MSRRTNGAFALGALAAASILCAACASTGGPNQMEIGLWAARHRLWDEAVYRWRRVLESEPGSAAAHNNLAVAFEAKGLWDDARREYEAALKLEPANARIRSNYDQFKKNMLPPDERSPEAKKKAPDAKRP